MLEQSFFDRDSEVLARDLLGKVIRSYYKGIYLSAMILETEAYYMKEKGSHSHTGCTPSRKAMFMPAGTIYMYYSRGKDSLNVSSNGEGNAVLIKAGVPYCKDGNTKRMIKLMQELNPHPNRDEPREEKKLCVGQTLLCKSLNLRVADWNQKQFNEKFYIEDVGFRPKDIIVTPRKGIPVGRDEDLPYRFVIKE